MTPTPTPITDAQHDKDVSELITLLSHSTMRVQLCRFVVDQSDEKVARLFAKMLEIASERK